MILYVVLCTNILKQYWNSTETVHVRSTQVKNYNWVLLLLKKNINKKTVDLSSKKIVKVWWKVQTKVSDHSCYRSRRSSEAELLVILVSIVYVLTQQLRHCMTEIFFISKLCNIPLRSGEGMLYCSKTVQSFAYYTQKTNRPRQSGQESGCYTIQNHTDTQCYCCMECSLCTGAETYVGTCAAIRCELSCNMTKSWNMK